MTEFDYDCQQYRFSLSIALAGLASSVISVEGTNDCCEPHAEGAAPMTGFLRSMQPVIRVVLFIVLTLVFSGQESARRASFCLSGETDSGDRTYPASKSTSGSAVRA